MMRFLFAAALLLLGPDAFAREANGECALRARKPAYYRVLGMRN